MGAGSFGDTSLREKGEGWQRGQRGRQGPGGRAGKPLDGSEKRKRWGQLWDDKNGKGQTSHAAAMAFQARHGDDIINQSMKSLILKLALHLANAIHILSQIAHGQAKRPIQATCMGKYTLSSKWSTWVFSWGPCDLRRNSTKGSWGLGRFAGGEREDSPIVPLSPKPSEKRSLRGAFPPYSSKGGWAASG